MGVYTKVFKIRTKGEGDMIDITSEVRKAVKESGIRNGIGLVFCPGSTASIITIEYEPGLQHDMREALKRLIPKDIPYQHELAWHDGNGHSHIRASFLGQDFCFPIVNGRAVLGTWQQVVFMEQDIRPRERQIYVQIVGERMN